MSDSRKKLLEKVRAILSKTMENGCTEGEAMAALAKARELMATYAIDESELKLETEKATVFKTAPQDPYDIKKTLSVNVGKFTSCKAFRDREQTICFAGKESDILFATWLLETLQRYVMRALRQYQGDRAKKHLGNSNWTSASFAAACTARISEKLDELAPKDWAETQALIVKELNMQLTKSRGPKKQLDPNAVKSGYRAGAGARFDRPVGTGGGPKLIT